MAVYFTRAPNEFAHTRAITEKAIYNNKKRHDLSMIGNYRTRTRIAKRYRVKSK